MMGMKKNEYCFYKIEGNCGIYCCCPFSELRMVTIVKFSIANDELWRKGPGHVSSGTTFPK